MAHKAASIADGHMGISPHVASEILSEHASLQLIVLKPCMRRVVMFVEQNPTRPVKQWLPRNKTWEIAVTGKLIVTQVQVA